MTATVTHRSIPPRTVKTRRIDFRYPTDDLPRHYVGDDDLVMSHVVTVLSAMFPEGEDFFVRSVRSYRDRLTDPELKDQVAGFIGQEAMHGREHRAFNDRLGELGYPARAVDRHIGHLMKLGDRVLPKRTRLAITAALEHYTATLAEVLLTDRDAQAMLRVDEIRLLLLWHALEESEHKSVAFDVFQEVCGKNWVRRLTMQATTLGFLLELVLWTGVSLAGDRAVRRHPVRLARSLARLRHSPFVSTAVLRRLWDYNRADFHPDDHDTASLMDRWRADLFGQEGELADRLKGAPAGTA